LSKPLKANPLCLNNFLHKKTSKNFALIMQVFRFLNTFQELAWLHFFPTFMIPLQLKDKATFKNFQRYIFSSSSVDLQIIPN